MPKLSARRHLVRIAVLFCFVNLYGCSKNIDASKLVGRYEAHSRNGFETIELGSNGTYIQYFTSADRVKSTYSNTWKFEPIRGEPKVALRNFTSHFPESQKADVVLLSIQKDWGRIRLYRSYDLDQYYVKVEPENR